MRVTVEKPREGVVLAERFLAEHGTLEEVQAELRRLRGLQRQRPEDGYGQGWLLGRTGADYRMRLVAAETGLRAEQTKQAMLAKRLADARALAAERQAEVSLSLEQRVERVEAALRRGGRL